MSTTVSPASDGNRVVKADNSKSTKDRTLHVDMAEGVDSDIAYDFVPLIGDNPLDRPFWHNLTRLSTDVRGLGAMTARFISNEKPDITSMPSRADANKIRLGVWRALEELLLEHQLCNFLPSIVFNQAPLDGFGRRDIIDLVFPDSLSARSYNRILRSYKKLTLEEGDDEPKTYSFLGATNTLPGSVLALDCHGLPIEDLDPQSVFEALKVVVAPAGVLLGFGKVVLACEEHGISDQYSGFIRGFIKLPQDKLAIPFDDFLQLLPTHFKCNGVLYNLAYPGSKLHKKNLISSNFPVALVEENRANGSQKRGSAATDEGESSSAAKRQRRSEAWEVKFPTACRVDYLNLQARAQQHPSFPSPRGPSASLSAVKNHPRPQRDEDAAATKLGTSS